MAHMLARQFAAPSVDRRHQSLSVAESLEAARAAQQRERDEVFDRTGVLILPDGRPLTPVLTFPLSRAVAWRELRERLTDAS
jgi:hypothetical protein